MTPEPGHLSEQRLKSTQGLACTATQAADHAEDMSCLASGMEAVTQQKPAQEGV
jgi:hypothetical protein